MNTVGVEADCIRAAWQGRISGCMLGKPVEVLSFQEGIAGLEMYLRQAQAYPLRNYVPLLEGTVVERTGLACCRENIVRNEYNDRTGAQIRAGLYGWVCPGRPALAAELATRVASLLSLANLVDRTVAVACKLEGRRAA